MKFTTTFFTPTERRIVSLAHTPGKKSLAEAISLMREKHPPEVNLWGFADYCEIPEKSRTRLRSIIDEAKNPE